MSVLPFLSNRQLGGKVRTGLRTSKFFKFKEPLPE